MPSTLSYSLTNLKKQTKHRHIQSSSVSGIRHVYLPICYLLDVLQRDEQGHVFFTRRDQSLCSWCLACAGNQGLNVKAGTKLSTKTDFFLLLNLVRYK